ncbi:MAG: hypothetical protein ACO3ZD_02740 [Cyanobium sp.]
MALAGDPQGCRLLRTQRDGLASAAMEEEMALVRSVRAGICPDLARQAEAANARDLGYVQADAFDYAEWTRCRQEAEHTLRGSKPPRYRNHKGFVFYTHQGAHLAERADQLGASLKASECP